MDTLCCGFAARDITPDPGQVYQDGYGFRLHAAEGIADRLYVKVCAFVQGDFRYLIAQFDVCGFGGTLAGTLREHIAALTGGPYAHTAVCATHTHAGPACGVLSDMPINGLYWARVGETAGLAAKDALASAVPGRFRAGFGGELTHSHNRRGRPAHDPRIRAAGFYDASDTLRGILANAACHAVIRTDYRISADFPGVLTRAFNVPALYLQGACGDINPYTPELPDDAPFDKRIELVGGELVRGVKEALACGNPCADGSAHADFREVTVPMRAYPDMCILTEKLAELERGYYAMPGTPDGDVCKRIALRELLWHRHALTQVCAGRAENALTVPLSVLTVGGIAFAFLPFEVLTKTGAAVNALLHHVPDACRYVVECANGTYGYLATAETLAEGDYESASAPHWYGLPECSEKSEDAVLDGFQALLSQIFET